MCTLVLRYKLYICVLYTRALLAYILLQLYFTVKYQVICVYSTELYVLYTISVPISAIHLHRLV